MRNFSVLLPLVATLQACEKPQTRLECEIQETGAPNQLITITGRLAPREESSGEARDFSGTAKVQPQNLEVAADGSYYADPNGRSFELVTFSETDAGKLHITVMPKNKILKQRGLAAVVMRAGQTVADGTPARARCRIIEPS